MIDETQEQMYFYRALDNKMWVLSDEMVANELNSLRATLRELVERIERSLYTVDCRMVKETIGESVAKAKEVLGDG